MLTLPPVALALWPQIPRDAAPAFQGAPMDRTRPRPTHEKQSRTLIAIVIRLRSPKLTIPAGQRNGWPGTLRCVLAAPKAKATPT